MNSLTVENRKISSSTPSYQTSLTHRLTLWNLLCNLSTFSEQTDPKLLVFKNKTQKNEEKKNSEENSITDKHLRAVLIDIEKEIKSIHLTEETKSFPLSLPNDLSSSLLNIHRPNLFKYSSEEAEAMTVIFRSSILHLFQRKLVYKHFWESTDQSFTRCRDFFYKSHFWKWNIRS